MSPVCRDKARPDVGQSHGYWKDLLNILALAMTEGLHQHKLLFLYTIQKKESRLWKAMYRKARKKLGSVSAEEAKVIAKERRARQAEWRYTKLNIKLEDRKYLALYVAVARLFSEQLLKNLWLLVEIQGLDSTDKRVHELIRELSLAGKWAPTSGLSHDRYTNITSAIALLIYHSRDKIPNLAFPSALEDSSLSSISTVRPSMTILRSYMQRWILTPLRAVTQVTEPLMTTQKWTPIQYNRVPSLCMQRNMEHFYRHDPTGFEKYLIDVESGKQHISGATLLPHTLALKAIELGWAVELSKRLEKESTSLATKRARIKAKIAEPQLRVVEAQWNTMIERIRESGALEGSLAICDVSGSMGSLYGRPARGGHPDPIVPAVALSLVLTQLAKPPFDQGYITFSKDPKFVRVEKGEGMGLYESLMYIQDTDPGLNTDFEKVFLGLLLPLAKEKKVPREDMPKRLFVFSDMQFDEARRDLYGYVDWEGQRGPAEAWKTSYDVVKGHFEEAGYEVPEIVFWDLAGYGTVEVDGEREGVAMMNGFSPNMMKVFMGEEAEAAVEGEEKRVEEEEVFNPVNVMRKAVMKKCFDGLVVMD
ncbi:hypothetical protein V5O48_009506 [Marasmius crinis-equi]|uniref:DUF2828 domain-containing protein n=1 Tax=Marasmius crinis-equi TaxID=585013 RepID=A0ABR3FB53_9AGAR